MSEQGLDVLDRNWRGSLAKSWKLLDHLVDTLGLTRSGKMQVPRLEQHCMLPIGKLSTA